MTLSIIKSKIMLDRFPVMPFGRRGYDSGNTGRFVVKKTPGGAVSKLVLVPPRSARPMLHFPITYKASTLLLASLWTLQSPLAAEGIPKGEPGHRSHVKLFFE